MSRHSKREEEERDILGELGGWLVYILLIIGLTYLILCRTADDGKRLFHGDDITGWRQSDR